MITAAALPIVSVAMFIVDPPSLEDMKHDASGTGNIRPLLCGQIGLIATWAALGGTRWYARWTVAGLIFLLTARTMPVADLALFHWFYLPWEIHTVALLSFTLFCALRAMGLRVEAVDATGGTPSVRQFDLRGLFMSVTCAAMLTLAWQYWFAVEVQRRQHWPAGLPDCRWLAFANATSFTFGGMVASLALLRRQPLRGWMLALLPAIAAFHMSVYRLTFECTVQPILFSTWWQSFVSYCRHDVLLHLGPVVCVLLLVRGAGYRLAWTGSSVE